MANDFQKKRRQQFLTEEQYNATRANQEDMLAEEIENASDYEVGTQDYATTFELQFLESLWIWMLDYTAGVDIQVLAPKFGAIVSAMERWCEEYQPFRKYLCETYPELGAYTYTAPFDFESINDYENLLQVLSIAILLRDRDSVDRIIHVLRSHRGRDALLEAMLNAFDEYPEEIDDCVIEDPYESLYEAYYLDDEKEVIEAMQTYVKAWYPAMAAHARWYNGHLDVNDDNVAAYYGYWAFEAGAVAYLLEIDDRSIKHMVYPKDLVAYGLALRDAGKATSEGAKSKNYRPPRIVGGEACTRTGYWETPAAVNSRQQFTSGQIMPQIAGAAFGITFWQWSEHQ